MLTQLTPIWWISIIYLLVAELITFTTLFYLSQWTVVPAVGLTIAITWGEELLASPTRRTIEALLVATVGLIVMAAGLNLIS